VRACAATNFEVAPQDGRPFVGVDFLEDDRFAPAVPQHCPPMRSADARKASLAQ
jgi:hypothetical protein